jgi:predicted SprT family Zn-dependent metalloprotease
MAAKRRPDNTEMEMAGLLKSWAALWGVPGLSDVEVSFSDRLTRSLGRTRPSSRRIVLAANLRSPSNRHLLKSVLCHEAAHIAIHSVFGHEKRPHGREWASLVEQAGETPQTRAPAKPVRKQTPKRPRRWRYVHCCGVCHAVRVAYRPVLQWRCVECVELGLDGDLEIIREPIHAGVS